MNCIYIVIIGKLVLGDLAEQNYKAFDTFEKAQAYILSTGAEYDEFFNDYIRNDGYYDINYVIQRLDVE